VTLYLVRHGIAEAMHADGDGARRLTPEGRTKMKQAAVGLARLGVRVDVLLTSPLPRAAETAAILSDGNPDLPVPRDCDALATGASPVETLRQLRPWADVEALMLVGHEPTLSRLAALLLTGSPDGAAIEMKKGACLALEIDRLAPHGGAALAWLMPPRALRLVGR
jgi:phosphohistidine phosphatase